MRFSSRFLLASALATTGTLPSSFAATSPAKTAPKSKASTAPLTLVQNGKSQYVIALAGDAIPAEQTAAKELQNYLEQVTGARLPIKPENEVAENAPQILVGSGPRAKTWAPAADWNKLGDDGILLKAQGNRLLLAGDRPRGTLYAVYEFLEKTAGVEWWSPTETQIIKKPTLRIAAQKTVYTPPFGSRSHYATSVLISDKAFNTRMRENGDQQGQTDEWGNRIAWISFVHTAHLLLPTERYFAEHPEWFSDPSNGNKPCTKNSPNPGLNSWQLNWTDAAMRRELIKNSLEFIRGRTASRFDKSILSISQNDNLNYCRSEGDMAMSEREGSLSAPIIDCINEVAAAVEKEFPNVKIETLAYDYSIHPPKTIRPRHNVIVRYCTRADYARPLDSDANKKDRDIINSWKAIAPNLFIWDYVTNFAHTMMPHPNLRTLAPNLRFFARSNVYGVFEQGDGYTFDIGDFPQLRTWLVSKLMWNPHQDDSKLIDHFMRGYYGPAAPHLRAYIDLMQKSFLDTGKPLDLYQIDHSYLDLAGLDKAWAYFAAAERSVAGDRMLTDRVRRARIPLETLILNQYRPLQREAASGVKSKALPTDIAAFLEEYTVRAKHYGIGPFTYDGDKLVPQYVKELSGGPLNYSEGKNFAIFEAGLRRSLGAKPAPLPEELSRTLTPKQAASEVVDVQENGFYYTWTWAQVDDPAASDGKAARVEGSSKQEQVLRFCLQETAKNLRAATWRAYAVVKVDPKASATAETPAFISGVQDFNKQVYRVRQTTKLGSLVNDGKYHLVQLGTWKIESGDVVYVDPPGSSDINGVFVDRVILVKDK